MPTRIGAESRRNLILGGALILGVITALFALSFPVTDINRLQEHWYLGIPFERIKTGFWIDHDDPFPQNGPHVMWWLTKVAYSSGSLLPLRLLQWVWPLVTLSLLWILLDQLTRLSSRSRLDTLGMALLVTFFWAALPLGFVYPVQTNGMFHGWACLAAGLLLLRRSTALAMLGFGFAYAAKAQFVLYFPCVVLYRLAFDYDGKGVARHLVYVVRDTLLLFVPAALILPVTFGALGWFRNIHDFYGYAQEGPSLLGAQLGRVLAKFSGTAPVPEALTANAARLETLRSEMASYSKLVYFQIFLSAGLGLAAFAWAVGKRLPTWWGRQSAGGPPAEIALLGVMIPAAWFSYFRFNNDPYCYNMLAMLPLNVVLVPYAYWLFRESVPAFSRAAGKAVYGLTLLLVLFLGFRYAKNFATLPASNVLKPYYWMQGQAWAPRFEP